jgi:uncharacterized protein (DUF427 family)
VRVLETSHPPTFYLPRTAFTDGVAGARSSARTFCEWKGVARYCDVARPRRAAADATSPGGTREPDARYPELTDRVAVYAGAVRRGSPSTG